MAKILITGGAGYIGSHMVSMLVQGKHDVVVFDNLIGGHKDALAAGTKLIVGDLANKDQINACLAENSFDIVMHFAALIQVGESVLNPSKYYNNNLVGSLNLIDAMIKNKVNKLIFSSSAAVYGEPQYVPVDVKHPKNPINPYGRSKWIFEQMLQDYDNAYGLKSISLRYFNAAGAYPEGILGPRHNVVSHLIPLVLQVASGRKKEIEVFGFDYPTKDGTCVRDYIHIMDLCSAHQLALEKLLAGAPSNVYNLGNGEGYSVLEVIKTAEKVTGKKIVIKKGARRAGDPAVLVADATLAKTELLWRPQYAELETIVKHAWVWEQKLVSIIMVN